MISHLRGALHANTPTHMVVDVGGVGYHVNIPLSSFDASLKKDDPIFVLTYLHVREDTLALYGFLTEAERSLFTLLISVSGIGPPLARQILREIFVPVPSVILSPRFLKKSPTVEGWLLWSFWA